MDVYGQEGEVRLLSLLISQLDSASVVDVGAERGAVAERLLQAGAEAVYAFEPHPQNAFELRQVFKNDSRATVYECAVSDADGSAQLHVATRPDSSPLPFGHTVLERQNTTEIAWASTITVPKRSLQSVVQAGEIPARVGILKIDTEGHDYAVVQGMGELQAELVMVEHWSDLPHGLGPCPWSAAQMTSLLAERGYTDFAFIVHRGEFVTLKWNDAEVEPGAMGNLLFLHESVVSRLLPQVTASAGNLAEDAVRTGQEYMRAALDRKVLLDELKQTADERLLLIEEVTRAADERLLILRQLEALAADRLARIRELERAPAT